MANQRSIGVLSSCLLCRRGLADLLGRKWHVVEHTALAQVSGSARSSALIVDLDHAEQDLATLMTAVRGQITGKVIPLGSALRQAASLTSLEQAGIETKNLEASSFGKLLDRRRPSQELTRQFRLWQRITPRQRSVLRLLAVGKDNRSIAALLDVGERAIKAHVSALLALFGLDNRSELALLAADAGLKS